MEDVKKKKTKPHAVCVPVPAQGHINPMLKLAKLLHSNGFHITFVHTEFNYNRILTSTAPHVLDSLPDFRFETISDGLPPASQRGIGEIASLCLTLPDRGSRSFREMMVRLKEERGTPAVSCVVSDGEMSFTLEVAGELGIPGVVLFTPSGCGMLGYLHFEELKVRGYFPLKDKSCLTNGYLNTEIDWIPAMKGIRLKDLPTFFRTTDPYDIHYNYKTQSVNNSMKAKGFILNTFDDLEKEVLDVLKTKFNPLFTIGPLSLLHQQTTSKTKLAPIESNLWKKDDDECMNWLEKREPRSVVYVNYGSLVTLTHEQLQEFGWGLANSKCPFLWVIRADLVDKGEKILSEEFMEEIKDRGILVGWCPQERVLGHVSVGGFLTHCGWNSVMESICEGIPLMCWPFFAEQQTNCVYACGKWGIGMEIDGDVKREDVERVVREVMAGEKGKEMRGKALEWKRKAEMAITEGGSSYDNFDRLVKHLMS